MDRSGPQRFEVEQIVAHVDARAAQGNATAVRDAAILRLLYVAALRRGEVCGLRVQDVELDHEDGPRVFPRRKGKREREPVLVGRKTGAALAVSAYTAADRSPTGQASCCGLTAAARGVTGRTVRLQNFVSRSD